VGFLFVLLGLVVMGYVLINLMIHGAAVPGFAFLASIITIFSGAQLFALGVFGEYLARMHFRSMDRPPYVVREIRQRVDGGDIHSDTTHIKSMSSSNV
jgi:undecaprenyl-phosphate 4-deoxy-4-formamido-L-arabinose transferase